MEDATKEDKNWGFDGDLDCRPLSATNGLGRNLHQVGSSKIQATSHISAQEFQPETNVARNSGISPNQELAKRMTYFRIGE